MLRAALAAARKSSPKAVLTVATPDEALAARTLAGMQVTFVAAPRQCLFRTDQARHYWLADEVFRTRWIALRDYLLNCPVGTPPTGDSAPDFVDQPAASVLLSAMAEADTIVIHGGGILTSATRSRLWEMGLLALYAGRHHKKLLLRSHQVGPFTDPADEHVMQHILNGAMRLTIRDSAFGQAEIERLRGNKAVDYRLLPDDALNVRLPTNRFSVESIGLKRNGYIAVGYRANKSVGVAADFLSKFAKVCEMARVRFGLPLVLVPQGDFDIPSLQALSEHLPSQTTLFHNVASQWDIVKVLEDARLTIATPHHSLIFALRKGKPVLSPVVGGYYAHKNYGSMQYFGLQDEVIEAENELFFELAEQRIAMLHQRYAEVRKRLQANVEALQKAIDQSESWFWKGAPVPQES